MYVHSGLLLNNVQHTLPSIMANLLPKIKSFYNGIDLKNRFKIECSSRAFTFVLVSL